MLKHNIVGVKSINDEDRIITFKVKKNIVLKPDIDPLGEEDWNDENELLDCQYKIKWFSENKIGNWRDVEEGGYVTWSI